MPGEAHCQQLLKASRAVPKLENAHHVDVLVTESIT